MSKTPNLDRLVARCASGIGALGANVSVQLKRFGTPLRSLLCAAYLCIEVLYIRTLPLIWDEFQNAKHVYLVLKAVPYRDYVPYKTIAGYLIQAPVLALFDDPYTALLAVKIEMAALVALWLFVMSHYSARRFGEAPTLGALLLLVTNSTFLERSADLRVDMLGALFGTTAAVAFIARRPICGGCCAGVALLMTQKASYFPVAVGVSGLISWAVVGNRASFRQLSRFTIAAVSVFGAYLLAALSIGGWKPVIASIFHGPTRIAFGDLYSDEIRSFWTQTLERNPTAYGMGVAALSLLMMRVAITRKDIALTAYATVLLSLCMLHKQPWPYFFVFILPTMAWVSAYALSFLQANSLAACSLGVLFLVAAKQSIDLRTPYILSKTNTYQAANIRAAEAFLAPNETYLAGMSLLFRREHAPCFPWLDYPRLVHYAQHPQATWSEFGRCGAPRLLVDTFRIPHISPHINDDLSARYHRINGLLSVYAPHVEAGTHIVDLGEGGTFKLETDATATVQVEGVGQVVSGQTVSLPGGKHRVASDTPVRFLAWSEDPRFLKVVQAPREAFFAYGYH